MSLFGLFLIITTSFRCGMGSGADEIEVRGEVVEILEADSIGNEFGWREIQITSDDGDYNENKMGFLIFRVFFNSSVYHESDSLFVISRGDLVHVKGTFCNNKDNNDYYYCLSWIELMKKGNEGLRGRGNKRKRYDRNVLSSEERLRRIVVIIGNMKEDLVSCTKEEIDKTLWQNHFSVKGIFEENSFGQIQVAGDIEGDLSWDIFGPFDIPFVIEDDVECDAERWAHSLDDLATQDGVNLENYQHRVYVVPRKTDDICSWEGLGTVGCGIICRAWINTCERVEVYVHELGHNLGLGHAASDIDELGDISSYGDPTAFMGNKFFSSTNQLSFNAPHKDFSLHWFTTSTTVTEDGPYRIYPLNENPTNLSSSQALVIRHPDFKMYYYFSFMTLTSDYAHKCLVHKIKSKTASSYFISALESNGKTFISPNYRFSVTQWSVTSEYMDLWVSFNCQFRPTIIDFFSFRPSLYGPFSTAEILPTLEWTRDLTTRVSPGDDIQLTVRIGNADSPLCMPILFTVDVHSPSGWNIVMDRELLLPPNQVCYRDMTVSIPNSVSNGMYPITVFVNGVTQDGLSPPSHAVSLNAFFEVSSNCTRGSLDFFLLDQAVGHWTLAEKLYYTISVITNDSSLCDPSTISFSASVPIGWDFSFSRPEIDELLPGIVTYVGVVITPPKQSTSCRNCTLTLRATRLDQESSIQLVLLQEDECRVLPPFVRILPGGMKGTMGGGNSTLFLALSTRDTSGALIEITNVNPPHCPAELFILDSTDRDVSFPDPYITLSGSQVGLRMVNFTSPMFSTANVTNRTFPMFLFYQYSNFLKLEVFATITAEICSRTKPKVHFSFPRILDNSVPWFQALVRLYNKDTWPCPLSSWNLELITIPPTDYTSDRPLDLVSIYPGNYTSWVYINITLPPASSMDIKLNVTDVSEDPASVHFQTYPANPNTFYTLPIGKCEKFPPILTPIDVPSNLSIDLGDTSPPISFDVAQNWSQYCDYARTFKGGGVGVEVVKATAEYSNGLLVLFDRVSVSLKNGHQVISAFVTSISPSLGISVIPGSESNITLFFTDQDNSSIFSFAVLNVTVTSNCIRIPPIVTVSPPHPIAVGRSNSLNYSMTIFNADSRNCTGSTFLTELKFPKPPSGWAATFSPDTFILPQTNITFPLNVTTRSNIPAGVYSIAATITDGDRPTHALGSSLEVSVNCSPPRPVTDINSKAIIPFFSFGLQAGPVFLDWSACTSELWCCCPCSWEIQRNGEVVGISQTLNFTDISMLEVGVPYVYTITTIDVLGVRSFYSVCDNQHVLQIAPPNLHSILFFMVVCTLSLILLFSIIRTMYYICINKRALQAGKEVKYLTRPYRLLQRFKRTGCYRALCSCCNCFCFPFRACISLFCRCCHCVCCACCGSKKKVKSPPKQTIPSDEEELLAFYETEDYD